MPQISRQFIKPEIKVRIIELLPQCISICQDQQIAANFINDLLTPTEILMIGKRVAIALMLIKGKTPFEISEKLKVSLTTINNVNIWLSVKGEGYRAILQEIIELDEKREQAYEEAENQVYSSTPRYGIDWKNAKRDQFQKLKEIPKTPF